MIWSGVVIIIISLLFAAFFSGIEIGVISISKIKLLRKLKQARPGAKITKKLLGNLERLLGTTLVGTNIAIVIASTLLTGLLYRNYPDSAEYFSLIILTPIVLIFCEAIPKAMFREYKNSMTIELSPILNLFYYIFYPIVVIINFFSHLLIRIMGGKQIKKNPYISRDELKIIALESYKGKEGEALRQIAGRIFYFGEKTAEEIMLPLNEIVMLEKTQTVKELREIFEKIKLSRYPVYSRKIDNLIGYINIKDILAVGNNKRISSFMRKVLLVEKDLHLEKLLTLFRKGAEQLVFVKENNSILGMITLEDVLEELVGEIKDEYEPE
ncbi:HlyC/CorC family transporter [Candidatus Dependentiae bacterium]|nr:HlyC/CorC family transporter [Candidatus Dependentiae bacterium]